MQKPDPICQVLWAAIQTNQQVIAEIADAQQKLARGLEKANNLQSQLMTAYNERCNGSTTTISPDGTNDPP